MKVKEICRREGPGGTEGDRRGVLLLFNISEEGPGETWVKEKYYYYLIYRRKRPGRIGGDRRGVLLLLLFNISRE